MRNAGKLFAKESGAGVRKHKPDMRGARVQMWYFDGVSGCDAACPLP